MGKDVKLDRANLVKEVRRMNEKAAKKRGKAGQERAQRMKELRTRLADARAEMRAARLRKEASAAETMANRVAELEEQVASEERASEGGVQEALRALDTARDAARKEAEAAGRRQRQRQRRRRRAELIESAGKPARHTQSFRVRMNAGNAIARENALLLEPTESRFRFRDSGPNPPRWAPPSHAPDIQPADLSSCSEEYRRYVARQMRIRQEREEREERQRAREGGQTSAERARRPPWTRAAGPPRAFTPDSAVILRAPTSSGAQSRLRAPRCPRPHCSPTAQNASSRSGRGCSTARCPPRWAARPLQTVARVPTRRRSGQPPLSGGLAAAATATFLPVPPSSTARNNPAPAPCFHRGSAFWNSAPSASASTPPAPSDGGAKPWRPSTRAEWKSVASAAP